MSLCTVKSLDYYLRHSRWSETRVMAVVPSVGLGRQSSVCNYDPHLTTCSTDRACWGQTMQQQSSKLKRVAFVIHSLIWVWQPDTADIADHGLRDRHYCWFTSKANITDICSRKRVVWLKLVLSVNGEAMYKALRVFTAARWMWEQNIPMGTTLWFLTCIKLRRPHRVYEHSHSYSYIKRRNTITHQ